MRTLKIVKTLSLIMAGAMFISWGPASAKGPQQKLTSTIKPNRQLVRYGALGASVSSSMHRKIASQAKAFSQTSGAFKSLANTRARRGFAQAGGLIGATLAAQLLNQVAGGPPLANGTISPQGIGGVTMRPAGLLRPPVPVITGALPLVVPGDPLAPIEGPPVVTGAVSPQGTAGATVRPGAMLKPPVPAISLPAPMPAPVTIH